LNELMGITEMENKGRILGLEGAEKKNGKEN
jgi:hypothetical protein